MGKVDSPNHLKMFVSFLFDNISHESLKLVVLIVPGAEDFKTVGHNLFKLFKSNDHEPSCAQNLKYTAYIHFVVKQAGIGGTVFRFSLVTIKGFLYKCQLESG